MKRGVFRLKRKNAKKIFFGIECLLCGYILYTIVFHQQGLMNHKRQEMKDLEQKIEYEKKLTKELNKEKENINGVMETGKGQGSSALVCEPLLIFVYLCKK